MKANEEIGSSSRGIDVDFKLYGQYGISIQNDTVEGKSPLPLSPFSQAHS